MADRYPIDKLIFCQQCGIEFKAIKDSTKYCSRTCQYKSMESLGAYYVCIGCGDTYFTKRKTDGHKYCSRSCAFEHKSASPFTRVYQIKCDVCLLTFYSKNSNKKRHSTCKRKESVAKETYSCAECGIKYRHEFSQGRPPAYCSSACRLTVQKRRKKLENRNRGKCNRRRARRYGVHYENVDVISVLQRDGWRCQICNKRTPQARRGTMYSNAPEIDHRIPLSKGGIHAESNLQCACRSCNQLKGNRTSVGQLPLLEQGRGLSRS